MVDVVFDVVEEMFAVAEDAFDVVEDAFDEVDEVFDVVEDAFAVLFDEVDEVVCVLVVFTGWEANWPVTYSDVGALTPPMPDQIVTLSI